MQFETFMALRYLFALRKQSFISLISLFAVCGVGIGVGALIVVLGVMNGFTTDLRDKILGVNAHILVSSLRGGVKNYNELVEKAEKVPGVEGVAPFLYSEVMLSTPSGVKGVVLRGIDPKAADNVFSLKDDIVAGSLEDFDIKDAPPGIVIGYQMAKRLGLTVGEHVNLLSPAGRKTAAGYQPKVSLFRVAAIFRTGMFEYDSTLGYVTIADGRKLLGYGKDFVSGIEIRIDDPFRADEVSRRLKEEIGTFGLVIRHWKEMNANLFAALELEKTAMFIILAMIVLVGSFSIVNTLVMLVMQKTKDIAVLMSLGAEERSIRKIFMIQGTLIGTVGTILGFALGVPVSLLLKKYQFIKLPQNVYPTDYLPVLLDPFDLCMIGVSALLLCFLATIYPARRAASLNPSEALRYE